MKARNLFAVTLLAAIAIGTLADRARPRPIITIDGFRVLAADFHTHSSIQSSGALTPFGLVLQAQRDGLDAIVIADHNRVAGGKIGRWFATLIGGPIVLAGEEVVGAAYHFIAAGITSRIDYRHGARRAIEDVHRQGGIAIAAHPRPDAQDYDSIALQELDGTEVCHPLVYAITGAQREFESFASKANAAAIGSSDFHGLGPMGTCRTFVFAREASERGILDAIRERRTVVYGLHGNAYGDPRLIRMAEARRLIDRSLPSPASAADWFSRIAGIVGLAGVIAANKVEDRQSCLS